MSDLIYYKVTGGAVMEAITRFQEMVAAQYSDRLAFSRSYGAEGFYGNTARLSGLRFAEGKAPADWQPVKGEPGIYKPDARTKAGRQIKAAMHKLPCDNRASRFQEEVLGVDDPFRFMSFPDVKFMRFEIHGGCRVLLVPKTKPRLPGEPELEPWNPPDDGCVRISTSEYWQIREAAESQAKEATHA